jgi:hypothetical protein
MAAEPPSWLQTVANKFEIYNKEWIPLIFKSYSALDAVREPNGGYRYVFDNCRLRVAPDNAASTCGSVGGVTGKGAACRKPSFSSADGRCAAHPYKKVEVTVVHDRQPCSSIRPIGERLPWSSFRVVADGLDVTNSPSDFEARRFVSAEHVWSELMLAVSKSVNLETRTVLTTDDNKEILADPLWPSTFLINMFPNKQLNLNNHNVKHGYTLKDYGVVENSKSTLKII